MKNDGEYSLSAYEELLVHLKRADLKREGLFLLYARLIEERFTGSKVSFLTEDAVLVEWGDGRKIKLYLANMAVECEADSESRREIVERYLLTLQFDQSDDVRGDLDDVIPIIKDSHYREYLKEEAPFVSDHLAGDLWVIYALDLPESTISLTRSRMDSLGVTKEKIRLKALDNLRRILPEVERHGEGPWFLLTAGGVYVASVLLMDSVWDEIQGIVDGDVIAVAPSRDVVLFTGSRSRDGILAIREKANGIFGTGDHVVSPTMLRRIGGRWSVYE